MARFGKPSPSTTSRFSSIFTKSPGTMSSSGVPYRCVHMNSWPVCWSSARAVICPDSVFPWPCFARMRAANAIFS